MNKIRNFIIFAGCLALIGCSNIVRTYSDEKFDPKLLEEYLITIKAEKETQSVIILQGLGNEKITIINGNEKLFEGETEKMYGLSLSKMIVVDNHKFLYIKLIKEISKKISISSSTLKKYKFITVSTNFESKKYQIYFSNKPLIIKQGHNS
ncbi:hypothetical protein OX283_002785 [Flavobacterium sp. SUN052]|uniref:hypothetical protein n=1 Tax=Flavobacterium sp. SUN052 TaxID=3002441 RepID=UPI00237DC544|nr:hypothetical protein [Flavobacterium sp. SUN052]MEC4003572.1 hypothetical protein [Flavobacterium sp. SUN052]